MEVAMKNRIATELGKAIETARLDRGYETRTSFVEVRTLKGKITHEGVRKIERGERIPQKETLKMLCRALGITKKRSAELERMALQAEVERDTVRRFGKGVDVSLQLQGVPVTFKNMPPSPRAERLARGLVNELGELVWKYGLMVEDLDHFRVHARRIILKKLDNGTDLRS